MNIFEAERVVILSLIKQGAFCRTETIQDGLNSIIASWKSTIWRIIVKTAEKELSFSWPSAEEIQLLMGKANSNRQTLVIAFVNINGSVTYKAAEDGRVIRPRCIIKLKKTEIPQKSFKELL